MNYPDFPEFSVKTEIISNDSSSYQLIYKCVNVNGQLQESVYLYIRENLLGSIDGGIQYLNLILNAIFEGRLQLTRQNMEGCFEV